MGIQERVAAKGPKKILALDGGGIRGLITVEVLVELEEQLRAALGGKPDFVLADYFDFVGGTSTGAIIAACVSLGMPALKIREFYLQSGVEMFDRASLLRRWRHKFEDEKLSSMLREVFGEDTTLGSERLRSVLLIVTRNVTTDSPWPISSNPFAKYNATDRDDCNLKLPLWQLVRASTAAPTYFPPEVVKVGTREFVFVDGGITPYNNPAFLAFLMATSRPYRMGWATGEKNLLVVSVGTGTSPGADAELDPSSMNLLYNAANIPGALMYGALNEQDMLCRIFGKCLAGDPIDREVGDMVGTDTTSELIGTLGPVDPKLFTYLRYNVELSRQALDDLGLQAIEPKDIRMLDSVKHMDDLRAVGATLAKARIRPEHFDGFLTWPQGRMP